MNAPQHPAARGLAHRLKWAVAPLGVLAGAAIVVAYLMGSQTDAKRVKPPRSARLVETVQARVGDHRITVEAWGTVQAAHSVALQPQVAGEVQALGAGFEPGGRLEAGELILRIDPADYQLAVRQRRSSLTGARADLALEQGRRAVAEQDFALLEGEVTEAQRRLVLREPQLETARAAVAAAEAALAEAELALARTQLRAPFNALVLERAVTRGSRVGTGTALATLVDTDAYRIELAIPAVTLPWIELPPGNGGGARVRVYHDRVWPAGRHRLGEVLRLRGDLDEKGRMARLIVQVPDPLARHAEAGTPPLLLGAFVRAEIEGRLLENVVALDRRWVRDGDTAWVMDANDRLAVRPLEVVYRGPTRVYVRGGVAAGERIVTSDLGVAVAGMPLRTAPPAVKP